MHRYHQSPISALVALFLLFTIAGCAQQAKLTYQTQSNGVMSMEVQNPISPKQTLTHLQVPEGFEVKIFAAEPDIVNPIAFSWDERGRLWVVESTNYPHEFVGTETGNDRITICEDTNGDGKADKFTRFAENQPLSTGIQVVKGGALVGQAPDIMFMEDTDGDDVYDKKTKVIDNAFGTFDTHAVMSNLKYGIDNQIWGAVGYSGMFKPGTAPKSGDRTNQAERTLRMGVFRFTADGEVLEPIGQFNNNTWGLGIGEDNTIFGSTANNNHAIVVGIPMRYEAEKNVANVQSHYLIKHGSTRPLQQVDYRDGYTAAAGAFPYAGRRYPQKYWGSLMVTEPTGHLVHAAHVESNGAVFKEKQGEIDNLLASSDDWVAPVFADIGPDENMWIADWHNPVIQHNPDRRGMVNQIWSDNRGEGNAHLNPLRDTEHGRIYIIEYKGKAGDAINELSADDPDGLVRGLQSSNQFWRLTAQRLIIENNLTEVASKLLPLIQDQAVDGLGLNTAAVHALWTLHGLGLVSNHQAVVESALSHKSASVRKAAAEVLPASNKTAQTLANAGLFTDANLNTRLAAVLRVADIKDDATDAVKASVLAAREGGDEWIEAALEIIHPTEEEEEVAEAAPQEEGLPLASITINTTPHEMAYQQKEVLVYAGQPIELSFNNIHPDLHNVVILQPGTDINKFGEALNAYAADPKSKENSYIPPTANDMVVAFTQVLGIDQSEKISIQGLPAGEYPFICTVPGHWAVMQGILKVESLE